MPDFPGRPKPTGRKAVIYADITGIEKNFRCAGIPCKSSDSKAAPGSWIGGSAGKTWEGCGNICISEWLCALPGGESFYGIPASLMQGLSVSDRQKGSPSARAVFLNKEWYLRLVLEGEDRLSRNHEEKERSWNISYSAISEDWAVMENLAESMMDHLVKQETVAEILQILTDKQKHIIQKYYLQEETQEQISRELGISQQAVSAMLSQAVHSIRKKYPSFQYPSDNTMRCGEGRV